MSTRDIEQHLLRLGCNLVPQWCIAVLLKLPSVHGVWQAPNLSGPTGPVQDYCSQYMLLDFMQMGCIQASCSGQLGADDI